MRWLDTARCFQIIKSLLSFTVITKNGCVIIWICHNYNHSHSNRESLLQFIKKLQDKNKSPDQQKQAADAVSLYYGLLQTVVADETGYTATQDGLHPSVPEKAGLYAPYPSLRQAPILLTHEEGSGAGIAQWKTAHADHPLK